MSVDHVNVGVRIDVYLILQRKKKKKKKKDG
jgi:hypothetical protein